MNHKPSIKKRMKKKEIVNERYRMVPFGSNLKVYNFIAEDVPVIRGMNLHEGGFNKKNFGLL